MPQKHPCWLVCLGECGSGLCEHLWPVEHKHAESSRVPAVRWSGQSVGRLQVHWLQSVCRRTRVQSAQIHPGRWVQSPTDARGPQIFASLKKTSRNGEQWRTFSQMIMRHMMDLAVLYTHMIHSKLMIHVCFHSEVASIQCHVWTQNGGE